MSNDLAGSQRSVSPGFDPAAQDNGLPSGSLREGWATELRALEQADSLNALALGIGRTSGWLTALKAAQVITWATYTALDELRTRIANEVRSRLLEADDQ